MKNNHTPNNLAEDKKRQAPPADHSKVDTTEEIVAIAGLAPTTRKRKTSLAVLASLAIVAVLGVVAVIAVIHLNSSLVKMSDGEAARKDKGDVASDKPISQAERSQIRGLFEGNGQAPARKSGPIGPSQAEKKILSFYKNDQKTEVAPISPRQASAAVGAGDVGFGTGTAGTGKLLVKGETEIASSRPADSLAARPLSTAQISEVFQKHHKQIRQNIERLLKENPGLSGKLILRVKLKPSGQVEHVRLASSSFHGTAIEEYLVKEIKRWKFPSFEGQAFELEYPLIL
ncbi:MAG: AgmX/PglI C-terminal domain-containing protein [Deltaproteobacteria bacterium]|nr:AgmX/PglI C-terminal domain-containing protein [Deltaproteobacteria bacterium]